MMIRRFARPYAKAIMQNAGSTEVADAVRVDLAKFDDARRVSSELQDVYANPGIEPEAKLAITKTIAARLGLSAIAEKVLDVLIHNHRINDLGAIVAALTAFVNEATNTVVAEVRSAHVLSPAETEDLRRTLEKKFAKKVQIQVTPDPTLLGGFVARVGSEIYDASVVGKIEKFRESLA